MMNEIDYFRVAAKAEIKRQFGTNVNFAQKVGKSDSFTSQILSGSKNLTFDQQNMVALALGKSVLELTNEGKAMVDEENVDVGENVCGVGSKTILMFKELSKDRKAEVIHLIASLYADQLAEDL